MLTKAQWDAMTPQAQWDLAQSLMADVEAHEAAEDRHSENLQANSKNGISLKVIKDRYLPGRTIDDLMGAPTLSRIRSMPEDEFNQLFGQFDDEDMTY